MASHYELDVSVISGKNLKNVNWKNGDLRPYVVLWVDPATKVTTGVDQENDDDPIWDARVVVPIPPPSYGVNSIEDGALYVDVVHAVSGDEEGVNPLVGSAKLKLKEVIEEVGVGESITKTLKLKRPSGRPHGKLKVSICVREPVRHYPPPGGDAYRPHGMVYEESRRDFGGGYGTEPVGYPQYAAAGSQPGGGYPYYGGGGGAPPTSGYPYYGGGEGGAPPSSGYPYHGGDGQAYGAPGVVVEEKKESKFGGMGTGLAVGAVAGVLGGLAIAEGIDYVEDKFDDEVAEQVEEQLEDDE
ncbi:Calcium-dependent lipid-binding (CaLB domain) family [Zostera marina]|uniref:Calcium-dependent lipid-binding (CaLB domain) family n=1 Tax=Zostera marina TaxID=29655 RepID=A0A0K9NST8_ZOSMR|nr:Calcium-dependent lipid-binding (CaLB domain) family [Zostera marina]